MLPRRVVLTALPLLAIVPASGRAAPDALTALESQHGGRLGVAMLDTGSGHTAAHRADERFALCSTFKWLAAACVLAQVDRGALRLDAPVRYGKEEVVTWSPVSGPLAGTGEATLGLLCEAAVALSDNTAGNLMLDRIGGPAGLTAWLRGLGDTTTRLDRRETALNEATPGDPRDTTTPAAMLGLLRQVLLGEVLSAESRAQLTAWLAATQTGDKRLKAGLPTGWRIGGKTGTGGHNSTNDVAILWPPERRAPVLVAAYYAEDPAPLAAREAVLAAVGRLATSL